MPTTRRRARKAPRKDDDEQVSPSISSPSRRLSAKQKELIHINHSELERRIKVIKAVTEASIETILTQLRHEQAKLSPDVLDMPLQRFLKLYCPMTESVLLDDGFPELRKRACVRDKEPASISSYSSLLRTPLGFNYIATEVEKLTQQEKNEDWMKNLASYTEYKFRQTSLQTPKMELRSQTKIGLTPKTERLPKPGEVLLSVNGSPLGLYGNEVIASIPEEPPKRARRRITRRL